MELARKTKPAETCNATKEELLSGGKYKVWDDCPVCKDDGILCQVGCHPTAAEQTALAQAYAHQGKEI